MPLTGLVAVSIVARRLWGTRTVSRPDLDIAGQRGEPSQRAVLLAGEGFGPIRAQQVGSGGGADEQRSAGEHPRLAVAVEE